MARLFSRALGALLAVGIAGLCASPALASDAHSYVELFPVAVHLAPTNGVAPTVSTAGVGFITPMTRNTAIELLHFDNSLGHTTNVAALAYAPPSWRVGPVSPGVEIGVTSRAAYPMLRRPVLADADFRIAITRAERLDVKVMPCGAGENCKAAVGFGVDLRI